MDNRIVCFGIITVKMYLPVIIPAVKYIYLYVYDKSNIVIFCVLLLSCIRIPYPRGYQHRYLAYCYINSVYNDKQLHI